MYTVNDKTNAPKLSALKASLQQQQQNQTKDTRNKMSFNAPDTKYVCEQNSNDTLAPSLK